MKSRIILILTGLVFFFNPCFNMLDVLPDFIGAILIMAGIGSFIYFDSGFADAHRYAKYLLWISVLRLVLCVWTTSGHRDYVMPFTFAAVVLEAIFMIAFFKSLYYGAEYTLMRSGSKMNPKFISEAFTFSFIFTLVTRFLDFAPHIADLAAQDAELDLSHGATFKMPLAQLKTYLLAACLACALILGVIYLFVTAKAWIKLIRDKEYRLFLKEKHKGFMRDERDSYVTRRVSFAYVLMTVAFAFTASFYIDGINIIPSHIAVILFFASSWVLVSLYGKKPKVALFAAAFVSVCVSSRYMSKVHLGINYLYSVESYGREEFPLLSSEKSVVYALIFCLIEALLLFAVINYTANCAKNVFVREKRKNALTRLAFLRVLSFVTLALGGASCVLTAVCGFVASEPAVTHYVKNKAFITSGKIYEQMMANPDIVRYESFVTAQSVCYILSVLTVIACIIVVLNMSRSTEGDEDSNKR